MKVKVKKLDENAVIPTKANPEDAGLDLTAISVDFQNQYIEYDTGLALEIPPGFMGLIFARSSISKVPMDLCNAVGVIDSSYRGPVKLRFRRTKHSIFRNNQGDEYYKVGDRIGQLIILPYPEIVLDEVEELCDTDRGSGGFGSSGN